MTEAAESGDYLDDPSPQPQTRTVPRIYSASGHLRPSVPGALSRNSERAMILERPLQHLTLQITSLHDVIRELML